MNRARVRWIPSDENWQAARPVPCYGPAYLPAGAACAHRYSTSPSPLLGRYGNHDGREHQQYFLHDENHQALGCPFSKLAQNKTSPIEGTEQAA